MKSTELVLAINEPFGSVSCNFYRTDDTGDIWMTREQIGMALEYADPRIGIAKIHERHRERLDKYSVCIPLERGCQFDHPYTGGEQDTYLYSNKGIMEICRWSKQPKADQFIDFVWEVMDKLIKGDLALMPTSATGVTELAKVNQQMVEMQKYLAGVNEKLAAMEQEQKSIKKDSSYASYYLHSQQYSGYDREWERAIMPSIRALAKFMETDNRTVLRMIYREMEQEYGIFLDDFVRIYKHFKKVTDVSALSVISFSNSLRERFEAILDRAIKHCGIVVDPPKEPKSQLFAHLDAAIEKNAAGGAAH